MSSKLARIVSLLMIGSWTGLLVARGKFWDPPADRLCKPGDSSHAELASNAPDVHVIVPARNEAVMLPATLPTLFRQRYAGKLHITLADDSSSDGTAACARELAAEFGAAEMFAIATVPPRPAAWAGKTWAMAAGVAAARRSRDRPAFWLFTDADIAHEPSVIASLVATAQADRRDLVSLMVQLRCATRWERLLIPAFVFFFAKLYPFAWVADEKRKTAAAAGGCILISDDLLAAIGGVERIANALIDDCALAAAVKAQGGRLRLELSTAAHSLRPYDSLASIWEMVARSAYTQLRNSPVQLAGAVAGMLFLYALPPLATLAGCILHKRTLAASGALSWALMSAAYLPILRRYGQPAVAAPLLPLAAGLYTLMTVDSARRHWNGRGGAWKGRLHALGTIDPDVEFALRQTACGGS